MRSVSISQTAFNGLWCVVLQLMSGAAFQATNFKLRDREYRYSSSR